MGSFKYALVLFDYDGCTDIVECKRLKTDKPVAQALQADIWWRSKLHKVEVLMVADSTKDIDEHELIWASSHRAMALDEEMMSGKKGGYLKVWPKELENDAEPTVGSHLGHKVKGKRPLLNRNKREMEVEGNGQPHNPTKKARSAPRKKVQPGKENRPADNTSATQRRKTNPERKTASASANKGQKKNGGQVVAETSVAEDTNTDTSQNHADAGVDGHDGDAVNSHANTAERRLRIEGSNGRSIAVLHEGSGEQEQHQANPNREPFFTEGLSEDQVDVIKMRLSEHHTGCQSIGTQTDKIIMFSNVEEMFQEFDPKRRTLDDIFTLIEEVRNKDLPKLVEEIQAKEPQGTIVSVLNLPIETVPTVEKTMTEPETKTNQEPELETGPTKEIETDFQDDLSTDIQPDIDYLAETSTSYDQAGSSTVMEKTDVSAGNPQNDNEIPAESTRIDTDYRASKIVDVSVSPIVNNVDVSVSPIVNNTTIDLTHLLLQSGVAVDPSYDQLRPGTKFEIETATEMELVPAKAEVRVSRCVQKAVRDDCTISSQFAWKLTRKLFKDSELTGINFNGLCGKKSLSPRRKKAIECAVKDTFGNDKMWMTANIRGVNQGLRNMAASVKQREQRRLFSQLNNQLS